MKLIFLFQNIHPVIHSGLGVMTSFEHTLVSGKHFIGYTGWEQLNRPTALFLHSIMQFIDK